MLTEFMRSCTPVLPEEKDDYDVILQEIENNKDPFIGFMPAIIEDLFPIYVMEDTDARQFNLHLGDSIYILPYGAHGFCGVQRLSELILKWYNNDEIDIGEQLGMDIDETILLKSDALQMERTLCVNGNIANAVYIRLSSAEDRLVHIVILIDTPHAIWTEVIEKYDVKTDILIDSHKGMGDWFDSIPLYGIMKNTPKRSLLPLYYLKGKFISHDAPDGFSKLYTIPKTEESHWCECCIYRTKWSDTSDS